MIKNADKVGPSTCEKILRASCEVFAENGYHKTTVRDICSRASVNVAAINYHFGGKEKLYEAVCKHVLGVSDSSRISAFTLGQSADPEERLRRFIESFLYEILDRNALSHKSKIMAWEMIEPSHILDKIVADIIRPRHDQICAIISALLGAHATEDLVKKCCFSIIGQCFHYRHARPVIVRLHPRQTFDSDAIGEIADHITRFSLGAMRCIASDIEKEE